MLYVQFSGLIMTDVAMHDIKDEKVEGFFMKAVSILKSKGIVFPKYLLALDDAFEEALKLAISLKHKEYSHE